MARILIRSGKSPFEAVSAADVLQRKVGGANVGNLVFSDSAHRMLSTAGNEVVSTRFSMGSAKDADRINDEFDVFVLPFANAFRPKFEPSLKAWTELIEKLTIPVVVQGIGAQASLACDVEELRPIDSSVRRFVSAVLDKSPSIGVRGEFTGRYLNSLGFSDVRVIGCPSMFRRGPELHVEKKTDRLGPDSRIAMSVTRTDAGDIAGLVDANVRRYPGLNYIAQDLGELSTLYWGDTSEAAERADTLPRFRTHPLFRENRVRLYVDPATWIGDLARHDFAFGTRIHGTVAALLGGTPGVVLAHDSRTLELARYFEIPHRLISDLPENADAADLYEEADFSKLLGGHRERFERMTGFLDEHGIDHVFRPGNDNGAAFDARLARVELAPPVEAWDGSDDGELGYRIGWLKEGVDRASRRQDKADKRIAELTRQVRALEKSVKQMRAAQKEAANSSPYRKARKAAGSARRFLRDRS